MRKFLSKLALCVFTAGLCAPGHAQQASAKSFAPTPPHGLEQLEQVRIQNR